jgi:hypothetical protein
MVAVDSRAIMRTLSAAGTQSRIGFNLDNLNEPIAEL